MASSEHLSSLDTDWHAARAVWSTVDIEIPRTPAERYRAHVEVLSNARHSYRAMTESLDAARAVSVDLNDLADRCRELCDALTGLDLLSSSRLAAGIRGSLHNQLTDAVTTLSELEEGLRATNVPTLPTKKPNEHLIFLVEHLADIFEQYTHKAPTVYTDRTSDERVGAIVGFVEAFNTHFLDGEIANINPRAIQRALQSRKKKPPPQL